MSFSVQILIGTFGADHWKNLAGSRPYPSAVQQADTLIFHDPDGTVASVRNELARTAKADYLCFLDGDDELAPGYIDAMERALEQEPDGSPLLLTPAVSYVYRSRVEKPIFWPECSLTTGNWMVIGTLVPRDLFWEVGGFEEWPIYEDWALWARCWSAGAIPVKVPAAIYKAHRKSRSRNHSLPRPEVLRVYEEMKQALFP
mgnify:CR=1 FL=1